MKYHISQEKMARYVGGGCGIFGRWLIRRHLARCEACCRQYDEARQLDTLLGDLRKSFADLPEPDSTADRQLLRRLQDTLGPCDERGARSAEGGRKRDRNSGL